jgi:hypothetical protein
VPPDFTLASCLAYSLNLYAEATCSIETSANFERTTLRYVPQDRTLQMPVISTGKHTYTLNTYASPELEGVVTQNISFLQTESQRHAKGSLERYSVYSCLIRIDLL